MITHCVIGLGYGDEGKGATTDALVRQSQRPLVVRFSGGHQAGHTVIGEDDQPHVFSNFGAGSLAGAPTFWSRYCTFHPVGYANEFDALCTRGPAPELIADGRCPVTTPYDLLYNRNRETKLRHGSCGLGFGTTVARHEGPHKLHVQDLLNDFVLQQKLRSVALYYEKLGATFDAAVLERALADFHAAIAEVRRSLRVTDARSFFWDLPYDTIIFEGSQGVLLDQEFGYFPHVTRAHTTSRNAFALCQAHGLPKPQVHYVTRCYQTRHGNGPLTNESLPGLGLRDTPEETNVYNPWQGHQRRTLLDVDQLRYALACDSHYAGTARREVVVTCLDQLTGPWRATMDGRSLKLNDLDKLGELLQLPVRRSGMLSTRRQVGAG